MNDELKRKIGELVGQATMCWVPRPSLQVFDSTQAGEVLDEILQLVEDYAIEVAEESYDNGYSKAENMSWDAAYWTGFDAGSERDD